MLLQTPTPDASQWNIGCVGSLALGLCVGHVHFIFFVLISFALGSRRKPSFQWNMGLTFGGEIHFPAERVIFHQQNGDFGKYKPNSMRNSGSGMDPKSPGFN